MTGIRTDLTVDDPKPPRPARLRALDILRGIAILGTLGTNIWILTDPEGMIGYIDRLSTAPTDAWMWVEKVLQQLAQGKFLGLLTVMFGIGLAIQQGSAQRGGRRFPGAYPWRVGLLFLDGVLNFVFIAEFDVLMGYAVTALIVAYVLARGPRVRRRWIVGAAGVHLTLLTVLALATATASQGDSSASEPLDPNPYADGSFWDLVLFRLENAGSFRFEPVVILPMTIALFLIGARLYRAGVFATEGARLRRRLMVVGFGIALPVDLFGGVLGGGVSVNWIFLLRYGAAPFVSLAVLALVAEFYLRRPHVGFLGRRMAEVGRTALSCYILQNLVGSILCYGWGFGLAVRYDHPAARVPFTIVIYLVVVVTITTFAHLWLRRFERGPVEWLWHTGYRRLAGSNA